MRYRLRCCSRVLSGPAAAARQQPAARGATSITMAGRAASHGIHRRRLDARTHATAEPATRTARAAYEAGEFPALRPQTGGEAVPTSSHLSLEVAEFDPRELDPSGSPPHARIWHAGEDVLLVEDRRRGGRGSPAVVINRFADAVGDRLIPRCYGKDRFPIRARR